ncbi:phage major capsid protein [Desemzia sp. RIT804]|uniref:phage major capsid family protein n=1 Tax=Desemzia sp. RIT 804 TaxID=2810209 RepID=UPI0019525EEF|nr:phage major capsid protein [Desemzia sp. RIT 804]MBM6615626.1 phage major capsid protein [Desemzia sp. RIT 804]
MVLERGTKFDPTLVKDLVSKVQGKSSLAVLSGQTPIPFNGKKEFVFTMDSEIDVVAESGKKTHGGVSLAPRTIVPIKVEYGARVTNEFMYASEEEQISILQAFNDGFAKKVSRGLDLMAFHGVNPRSGAASTVIGTNHFDSLVTQSVTATANANADIESAVGVVQGAGGEVSALAIAPEFRTNLAGLTKTDGNAMFPELAWGAAPQTLNGVRVDVNKTVSDMSTDLAVIGDFASSFKWGYVKDVPMEVIEYGDPDNSGLDLKGYNQVYIRAELYLGWGILAPENFARIVEAGA